MALQSQKSWQNDIFLQKVRKFEKQIILFSIIQKKSNEIFAYNF